MYGGQPTLKRTLIVTPGSLVKVYALFVFQQQQQQQLQQQTKQTKNKIDVNLSNGLRWPNSDSFMVWADETKGQWTNQNVVKTKRNCFGQNALSVVHLCR